MSTLTMGIISAVFGVVAIIGIIVILVKQGFFASSKSSKGAVKVNSAKKPVEGAITGGGFVSPASQQTSTQTDGLFASTLASTGTDNSSSNDDDSKTHSHSHHSNHDSGTSHDSGSGSDSGSSD